MSLSANRIFTLFIIAMVIIASGCNRQSKRVETLIASGLGIFRSVNFDMDIESVKKFETAPLVNSTENYLRYEIKKINNTNEYAEIEYHFSKDRLDLITVYFSAEKTEDIEALFQEMITYYTEKYGEVVSDDSGWKRWEFEDKEGLPGSIEIMMKQESVNDIFSLDIELVKYYSDERKSAGLGSRY
jgi:hypothetical protein